MCANRRFNDVRTRHNRASRRNRNARADNRIVRHTANLHRHLTQVLQANVVGHDYPVCHFEGAKRLGNLAVLIHSEISRRKLRGSK